MDTPAGSHVWITEETAAAGEGGEDAIVVQPRSVRLPVGLVAVLILVVIVIGVIGAERVHPGRSILRPASSTSLPPVGGKRLQAVANQLCIDPHCRTDVLDPPVLAWFESAFPDAVEGDGYAAYGPSGLNDFVTHLYTGEAVTVLCLGRRISGSGPEVLEPTQMSDRIGFSVFRTTLSVRRDGWEVTITLIAGQRPVLATASASAWLRTAVLP